MGLLPRQGELGRRVGDAEASAGKKVRMEPSYKDGGTVGSRRKDNL